MVDEFVTVKTFWNVMEVYLARNALEEADIQVVLENEFTVLVNRQTGNPAGVKLNVKPSDVQKAIETLKPYD